MPPIAENYSLGQSVEISKINKELKKLWQERENAMTRASLINLAIYSEKPGSLEKNTQLIARITQNHSCRALVIGANRKSKENRVEAWINAHCHVTRAGSKQICSEQLSFSLEGPCVNLLPSIVFSHLDSDLPLYLWWQEDFPDPMDPQLWAWVNRLIFDSQTWKDFAQWRKRNRSAADDAGAKQRSGGSNDAGAVARRPAPRLSPGDELRARTIVGRRGSSNRPRAIEVNRPYLLARLVLYRPCAQ